MEASCSLTLLCSGCGIRAAVCDSDVIGPAPLTIVVKHMHVQKASRGLVGAISEWLGTALLLLVPVLCALYAIEGLKAGKVLAPFSRRSVFISQQHDAPIFWIVIALYSLLGVVTAWIAVRLLKALWKHWQH